MTAYHSQHTKQRTGAPRPSRRRRTSHTPQACWIEYGNRGRAYGAVDGAGGADSGQRRRSRGTGASYHARRGRPAGEDGAQPRVTVSGGRTFRCPPACSGAAQCRWGVVFGASCPASGSSDRNVWAGRRHRSLKAAQAHAIRESRVVGRSDSLVFKRRSRCFYYCLLCFMTAYTAKSRRSLADTFSKRSIMLSIRRISNRTSFLPNFMAGS